MAINTLVDLSRLAGDTPTLIIRVSAEKMTNLFAEYDTSIFLVCVISDWPCLQ